jgi:hypothetical protein
MNIEELKVMEKLLNEVKTTYGEFSSEAKRLQKIYYDIGYPMEEEVD